MAQSTPKLNTKETIVTTVTSTSIIVGTSSTSSDNPKMRRGGVGELEIVAGNDSTVEGTHSTNKVQLNVKNALIGTNITNNNNVKLHRSGVGELGFVLGDDSTVEGNRSNGNALIQAKSLVLGDSPNQTNNVKLRRAGNGIAQLVLGDDTYADGIFSANYANLLGSVSVGSVVTFIPGYYLDGSNGTFVKADFISANTIAAVNTFLNPLGFWVADGTVPAVTGSLIWNAAGRHLPNLMTGVPSGTYYIVRVF